VNLHTARVLDSAALCGQPIYRFGWHIDPWDSGPNKNAAWHCACVVALAILDRSSEMHGAKFEDRTTAATGHPQGAPIG